MRRLTLLLLLLAGPVLALDQAAVRAQLASAADTLVAQGLPDPRGLEYRAVDIGHACHGWLRPDGQVLCWDGLVWPAKSVGEPADLAADVATVMDNEGATLRWGILHRDLGPPPRAHLLRTPLSAVLLQRVGQTDLANRLWMLHVDPPRPPGTTICDIRDGYMVAAEQWVSALYGAALKTMRTQPAEVALARLRELSAIAERIEAEGTRRSSAADARLDCTASVQDLIADLTLRLRQTPRPRAAAQGPAAFASTAAYAQALVADLSTVDLGTVTRGGLPAVVATDPTLRALAGLGDAAVPTLLDTLANDRRYTLLPGNLLGTSEPVPVWRCAQAALSEIVDEGLAPAVWLYDERAEAVARFRAWCDAYLALPPAERWYVQLRDATDRAVVLRAARRLLSPGFDGAPRGAGLRDKRDPSVAELLARRIDQVAASPNEASPSSPTVLFVTTSDQPRPLALADACELAGMLPRWGGAEQVASLRRLSAACLSRREGTTDQMLSLWRVRETLGDAAAWPEYLAWVTGLRPYRGLSGELFAPLAAHAADPAARALAERFFGASDSPWNPAAAPREFAAAGAVVTRSGLLTLPTARNRLRQALDDAAPLGSTGAAERGQLARLLPTGAGPGAVIDALADRQAPNDAPAATFSVAEATAGLMRGTWGLPPVRLYDPPERRRAAVAECARVLDVYGPRLGLLDRALDGSAPSVGRPALLLPKLERPATKADVAAGRAVFSFGYDQTARVVPLPAWPQPVRWVRPDATAEARRSPWPDGICFQAEERLEHGRWRRYYGYVGEQGLAQVPAEEIELVPAAHEGWHYWQPGLEARLSSAAGRPGQVALQLRNRRAVAQIVPAPWLRPTAEGAGTLRQGMVLELSGPHLWPDDLPGRRIAGQGLVDDGKLVELAPGEVLEAGRLDLRRAAGPLAPGWYRAKVLLTTADGGAPAPVWCRVEEDR